MLAGIYLLMKHRHMCVKHEDTEECSSRENHYRRVEPFKTEVTLHVIDEPPEREYEFLKQLRH